MINLALLLYKVSKKNPNKSALIEKAQQFSYHMLWDNIERLARAFWKIGIRKDDKAAIILPNCKEFIFSFFALLRINAVAVPLKPAFTGFELKGIFQDCNPAAIITTSSFLNKLTPENRELLENRIVIVLGNDKEEAFTFEQLYEMGREGTLPEISTENNQTASINYTYRGDGYPLGAVLTHNNYYHGSCVVVKLTKSNPVQKCLLILPISHIFALLSAVVFPLITGATVVIVDSLRPRRIFKAISEHQIDFMVAVPTIYLVLSRNYNKQKYDLSSLCYCISGGDSLSLEDYRQIKQVMSIDLLQGYGLTECLPITCNPGAGNKPGSLGLPWHKVEIKIVDEFGKEQAVNQIGEIVVGGPSVMQGYRNLENKTKKILKDGWLYTGDYGRLDKDGYLYFEGLKKKIVKVGGNTVDLTEVENTLLAHPAIRAAKVYAKPNSLWGHLLSAEVSLGANKEICEKELKSFCKQRLAMYKIPRTIVIKNQGADDYAERANSAI
jgi:long-chain acyl-CoA synthetase